MNTSMEKPVTETANNTIGTKLCHHMCHISNGGHHQKVFSNVRKKLSCPQGDDVLDIGQYILDNITKRICVLRTTVARPTGMVKGVHSKETEVPAPAHISHDSEWHSGSSVKTHFPKKTKIVCLGTKNTRVLCRKRTGEVVPRAEQFGQNNVGISLKLIFNPTMRCLEYLRLNGTQFMDENVCYITERLSFSDSVAPESLEEICGSPSEGGESQGSCGQCGGQVGSRGRGSPQSRSPSLSSTTGASHMPVSPPPTVFA